MSLYKALYIFVEGVDDERFIGKIVIPLIQNRYDYTRIIQYSQMGKDKVSNFIKSINSMNSLYFMLADINDSPCISARKDKLLNTFRYLSPDRIIIVKKEIESWIMAGLDETSCEELRIRCYRNTENLTKETFNKIIPQKFNTRLEFILEALGMFSISTARSKNSTFDYFYRKLID